MDEVDKKTEEEWKNTKQLVYKLLEEDERCRNDDKWLTYRVMQEHCRKFNKPLFVPFDIFQELPSYETVRRTRQIIQNKEEKYQPTKQEIKDKRSRREKSFRHLAKHG